MRIGQKKTKAARKCGLSWKKRGGWATASQRGQDVITISKLQAMETLTNLINKSRESIVQNSIATLQKTSSALLVLKPEELLVKFNPSNKAFALSLGNEIHYPNRTPKLCEVRAVLGDKVADSFLRIQIESNFTNLGVNCHNVTQATENIALSIRSFGTRLMLGEWLMVFHFMDNCEEVRREYNQANYVSYLKRMIAQVMTLSADQRCAWCKEELDAYMKDIRHQCFALGEISVADFDRLSAEKERGLDNKYFNY